jgi:plasmid replication initiation protein
LKIKEKAAFNPTSLGFKSERFGNNIRQIWDLSRTNLGLSQTNLGGRMHIALAKKEILHKHVAVIHSASKLTLTQRKIYNILLKHAIPRLPHEGIHTITISEICEKLKFNSNNHQLIKDALDGFQEEKVEWNVIGEEGFEKEEWAKGKSRLMASVVLSKSVCEYSYSGHLREFLMSPIRYGIVDMEIQARFKSSPALAGYENFNRYRGLGRTREYDIPLLKKLLGVPENAYAQFCDFKKRVIDVVVEEIEKYSDISVKPNYVMKGRKCVALSFTVQVQAECSEKIKAIRNPELAGKLVKVFGISKNNLSKIFSTYSDAYIEEKMNVVLNCSSYKNGKIQKLAPYLMDFLINGHNEALSPGTLVTNQIREEQILKRHKEQKEQEELYWNREYLKFKQEYLKLIWDDKKSEININFIRWLENREDRHVVIGYMKKSELDSPIVSDAFKAFLMECCPETLEIVPSREDFIKLKLGENSSEKIEQ